MEPRLLQYIELIQKWNKAYNLTAIDATDKVRSHHIDDSLAIASFIEPSTSVCDLGTGAGLPGIPLAIELPNTQFTLVDKVAKKIAFVKQAIATFKLGNATAQHARAEDLAPDQAFDVIVSRAVGDAELLIKISHHVLKPDGRWLLMKGKDPSAELKNLQYPFSIHRLTVPNLDAERHLVEIFKRD